MVQCFPCPSLKNHLTLGFLHFALCIFQSFLLKKFDKAFKSDIVIITLQKFLCNFSWRNLCILQQSFNLFKESVVTIDTKIIRSWDAQTQLPGQRTRIQRGDVGGTPQTARPCRFVPRGDSRIRLTRLKSAPTRPKSGRLGPYRPYRPKRPDLGRNSKKKKKKKGAKCTI